MTGSMTGYTEKTELGNGVHITDASTYYTYGAIQEFSDSREVYMFHVFKEDSKICVILQDQREDWMTGEKTWDDYCVVGMATGVVDHASKTLYMHPMHMVDVDKMLCYLECMWLTNQEWKKLFAGYTMYVDVHPHVSRDDEIIQKCILSEKLRLSEDTIDVIIQTLEQYGHFTSVTTCLQRISELSLLVQEDLSDSRNQKRLNEIDILTQKSKTLLHAKKYLGSTLVL